jgi:fructokinase
VRIGIDLGGTKIEIIAIQDNGTPLTRRRIETPKQGYHAILDTIVKLVLSVESELSQIGSVGVGAPGAISPRSRLIKNANSTVLIGKPLDRDLSERLGRPVRVENDANCFVLSEATDGAGRNGRIVFGVILGTGVGGGISIDRRILFGRNRIAGEWGHNPLPWADERDTPTVKCYCGKTGCIETYLSGSGLSREYQKLTGVELTAEHVARAADKNDPAAVAAIETYKDRLARGLATIINVIDPDTVVLGGGLSRINDLCSALTQLLERYVFSDSLTVDIVPALHGDSSGVRGAAWLWPPESTLR